MSDARRIALERIRILFNEAEKASRTDPERAHRYVDLARRIASRNRVHLPLDLRRRVCHGCKGYLGPATSRARTRSEREPHLAVTCLRCGHVNRFPLRVREHP